VTHILGKTYFQNRRISFGIEDLNEELNFFHKLFVCVGVCVCVCVRVRVCVRVCVDAHAHTQK
jgi:hypothetical protein